MLYFTEGTWVVKDGTEVVCGGRLVANTGGYSSNAVRTRPENEANARLIAAAPRMYEALKDIAKGEGRFSRDPLIHASNTIEDMKALAVAVLATVDKVR